MKRGNIVFIRADFWDTTQALPKAVVAGQSFFERINILEWEKKKKNRTERINTEHFQLHSFKQQVGRNSITRILSVLRFIIWSLEQTLRIKPDYIHFVGIFNAPMALLYKLSHPTTILIYEIRDPYGMLFKRILFSKWAQRIDLVVLNFVNFVVLPNEYLTDYLGNRIDVNDIFISPNFNEVTSYRLKSFNNSNKINLGYFGYLSETRGFQLLKHIVKQYKNEVVLHLAGSLTDAAKGELSAFPNVKYYGNLNRKESLSLMSSVDANLIAYDPQVRLHSYMLPIKFYDSCMVGTPVIVSKGMRALVGEVINNGLGYTVDYMTCVEFDGILHSLRSHAISQDYLKSYYSDNCNYDEFMRMYREFYKRIVYERI